MELSLEDVRQAQACPVLQGTWQWPVGAMLQLELSGSGVKSAGVVQQQQLLSQGVQVQLTGEVWRQ